MMASLLLHPGHEVAFVEKPNTARVAIRIRLKVYGPNDTLYNVYTVYSPSITSNPGRRAEHQWTIPNLENSNVIKNCLSLLASSVMC